jgi:hypothetical protein
VPKVSIKPIIPKELLGDPGKIKRVLQNAMKMSGEAVRVDFEVTTQTWNKQPKFEVKASWKQVTVGTNDWLYNLLDKGTPARIIRPVNAKALRFPGKWRAKTVPGQIRSRKGSSSGVRFAKFVRHPGIAARDFDETIAKKWEELFPGTLQRAIDAEL